MNVTKQIFAIIFIFCGLFFVGTAYSATAQFTVSLGQGSAQTTQVIQLQQFLIAQGFLNVPATGNYFSLTTKAVKAFQVSQGITPTGYFGPLTIVAANKKLTMKVSTVTAQPTTGVAVQSVKNNSSQTASAILSGSTTRTITWQTNGYPADVGVNINLLKKTSDSPASYTLVRQLAENTPNTGLFSWTPHTEETAGNNLYIEVTCSTSHDFPQGCQVSQVISAF
jgi:peptidoglycan hydrolase-like protein with peptidoglycan-binding domain